MATACPKSEQDQDGGDGGRLRSDVLFVNPKEFVTVSSSSFGLRS